MSAKHPEKLNSSSGGSSGPENPIMVSYPAPSPLPSEISLLRETVFVFCVCLAQLLTQACVAQTMNGVDAMAATFNVSNSPGDMSWFLASFSLTVGTFILISGRLGDMHGYKNVFLIGFVWLGVFLLAAGFSAYSHLGVLFLVFRGFQGIGLALCMPNGVALFGHYYPEGTRKHVVMCLFGAVAPSGWVVGALFLGLFVQKAWWPWTFWATGIACFGIAVVAALSIPKNIINHECGSFDWIGSVTGVCGLVLTNFACNQGPNVGWNTPYVYVLLIVGFLFLVAFLYSSYKVADPLIPPGALLGETGFVLLCIAAGWSCFGVWLYFTVRWLELVEGASPVLAAVHFIPVVFMGFAAAGITAFLVAHVPLSAIMLLALLAFLVGSIINGTRPVGQIYWAQKFVSLLILPFGMDMSFPAATIVLLNSVPRSQQGVAASLVSTFLNYSISIGLGLAGTVQHYTTKGRAPGLETTIYGIRRAFYMGMGLAGLGVVSAVVFLVLQHRHRLREQKKESVNP